jgi:hypothetical protein
MEGFQAAFRCGGLWKQDLEHASGYTNDALIFADADTEFDGGALGLALALVISTATWS